MDGESNGRPARYWFSFDSGELIFKKEPLTPLRRSQTAKSVFEIESNWRPAMRSESVRASTEVSASKTHGATETIIGVLELGWDAAASGNARDSDLMTPGPSS